MAIFRLTVFFCFLRVLKCFFRFSFKLLSSHALSEKEDYPCLSTPRLAVLALCGHRHDIGMNPLKRVHALRQCDCHI